MKKNRKEEARRGETNQTEYEEPIEGLVNLSCEGQGKTRGQDGCGHIKSEYISKKKRERKRLLCYNQKKKGWQGRKGRFGGGQESPHGREERTSRGLGKDPHSDPSGGGKVMLTLGGILKGLVKGRGGVAASPKGTMPGTKITRTGNSEEGQ